MARILTRADVIRLKIKEKNIKFFFIVPKIIEIGKESI